MALGWVISLRMQAQYAVLHRHNAGYWQLPKGPLPVS